MEGTVRFWLSEEGWGVIDAPEVPGGCWAHFSVIEMSGFHELHAGQRVRFVAERAPQDGYPFTAEEVHPEP